MSNVSRHLPPLSENARAWVRFIGKLLALILFLWLLLSLRPVFTPILAALAIAYILNPVVAWCEHRGLNRLVTIAALYFFGTALLLVLAFFVLSVTADHLADLQGKQDSYLHTVRGWLSAATTDAEGVPETADPASAPESVTAWWYELLPWLRDHGVAAAKYALGFVFSMLGNTFNLLTLLVLLPMYTFFFLWKFDAIVAAIRDHLPYDSRERVIQVARLIDSAIANFFRGRLMVCLIVALLTAVGWTLVGVPLSVPLGALAGLLNLVPFMSLVALPLALVSAYFGAVQAVLPGEVVNWTMPVLLAMAVYMAVQAIESFILTPLIESRSSGLHPVTTVVALLIGGQWAGLLGMLLAIPIASTVKALAAQLLLPEIRRLAAASPPEQAAQPANVHEPLGKTEPPP